MKDNIILNQIIKDLQKLNEKKKKLSKKQMKIAKAAPPPDEITGADFKALSKKKKIDEGDTNRLVCPNCGAHNPEGIDKCEKCEHPYPDKKGEKEWTEVASEGKASAQKQYSKNRKDSDLKKLDKSVADVNKALKTPNKKDDIAAFKARDEFEEEQKNSSNESIMITSNQLSDLISEVVEAEKLALMLEKIEDLEEKKKRKKRKKSGKSSKGLSKAVKKSLDKKADKRCFTRGSVYAEFRKGLAAFYTSGSRKGMSAHQWAHARVNSANPSKSWASVKKRKKCPKKKKK